MGFNHVGRACQGPSIWLPGLLMTKRCDKLCRANITLSILLFYGLGFLIIALFSKECEAGPWLPPGELRVRHDLLLLADSGVIRTPLATWPLSWGDIARDLTIGRIKDMDNEAVRGAANRIRRRIRREDREGLGFTTSLSLAEHPVRLRTFNNTPMEAGELTTGIEWTGRYTAARFALTGAYNVDDEMPLRFDDSYFSLFMLSNWVFSLDLIDRWWGPGWEGSLILSNNARPVPAVMIRRYNSTPFESRWLSWIGPWNFIFFIGQMEGARSVPHAKLIGMRLTLKPLTNDLEIGISRTAEWGGEGRPEDIESFFKMLLGIDNRGDGVTMADEPGNQLAGFDLRWKSPLFDLPYAVYAQLIGEDEAGGMPTKYIGLAGMEFWGALGGGMSWRLHVECADTAANFYNDDPWFDYAYNHLIYKDGYRYHGQAIGHSMDNDGIMLSAGALLAQESGSLWNLLARWIHLNRDGGGLNSVSASGAKLWDLQLDNSREIMGINLDIGAGVTFSEAPEGGGDAGTEGRVYARISRNF